MLTALGIVDWATGWFGILDGVFFFGTVAFFICYYTEGKSGKRNSLPERIRDWWWAGYFERLENRDK